MYKRMGVKYSFAAHLRDTGTVSPSFQSLNCRQKPSAQSILSMDFLCQSNGYDRLAKKLQGWSNTWQILSRSLTRNATESFHTLRPSSNTNNVVLAFFQPSSRSGGLCQLLRCCMMLKSCNCRGHQLNINGSVGLPLQVTGLRCLGLAVPT